MDVRAIDEDVPGDFLHFVGRERAAFEVPGDEAGQPLDGTDDGVESVEAGQWEIAFTDMQNLAFGFS